MAALDLSKLPFVRRGIFRYRRHHRHGKKEKEWPVHANAAAGPSSFFKFYAGEGGLRVPLIFSGPGIPREHKSIAFSFITDVTPTILTLAGIENPEEAKAGPMVGK